VLCSILYNACSAYTACSPARDLPIGILLSLGISTVLYVLVALVLTGMVPYHQISDDAPLSEAFGAHGWVWCEVIIAVGAVVGMTSVLIVTMMGQPRMCAALRCRALL
jgi:APA family basic amino acid/polyamine antiporter